MSASRRAVLLAAVSLAACNPQAVKLTVLSPYETSVVVSAHAMPRCVAEARQRAEKEAAAFCGSHGREWRTAATDRSGSDQTGCRVELVFGCALARQP